MKQTTDMENKRQAALVVLAKTGMWKSNYAPPYLRLCWRLGLDMPPPHFCGFWQNAAWSGGLYALVWGLLMYWMMWFKTGMPLTAMLGSALLAGLFFGLTLASYYAYGKRKHEVPAWRDFKPDQSSQV